jgi:hypothetical protein
MKEARLRQNTEELFPALQKVSLRAGNVQNIAGFTFLCFHKIGGWSAPDCLSDFGALPAFRVVQPDQGRAIPKLVCPAEVCLYESLHVQCKGIVRQRFKMFSSEDRIFFPERSGGPLDEPRALP